jgi:ATP-dependent exoDNAse (exonuclease V) alpha subunit
MKQEILSKDIVLIEGPGGTGKSTLLKEIIRGLDQKEYAVVAFTGVAALNVEGVTIHHYFGFKTYETPINMENRKVKKLKNLNYLIIDEISMVRADIMDMIDKRLKRAKENDLPFGGVKLIMFGDLYQLTPIASAKEVAFHNLGYETPFFFSANVFQDCTYEIISLTKVYRQKDEEFIRILNAIRLGKQTQADLDILNKNCVGKKIPNAVHLTPVNKTADAINEQEILRLQSRNKFFKAKFWGYTKQEFPTEEVLTLKEKARVMFVKNDNAEMLFVNGDTGTILSIGNEFITIRKDDGRIVKLKPYKWVKEEIQEDGEVVVVGTFKQYPIKLAYAITIHKSQGKTFEKLNIDLGYKNVFTCGQTYVALSRARSMENLCLKRPVGMNDIHVDRHIKKLFA